MNEIFYILKRFKNEVLVVAITVVTVIIWVGIGGHMNSLDTKNEKTLDKPTLIDGTIDIEYLKLIQ